MFRYFLTTGRPVKTNKSLTLPKTSKKVPPRPKHEKSFRTRLRAAGNKHPFRPPSNDPYEPTLSDDSVKLGLEIDMDPNPQNENGTTFSKTRKRALDEGEKTEAASKIPSVEQQKVNTNKQRIVYINFEGERPRLATFANAMIKLSNQRDLGSVREMPMRNGFSLKPKYKEASKLLSPQNIIQEFQKYKIKVNSNNNKSRKKVTPCYVITKVSLDVSLNTIKEQLNEQGIKFEKKFKVKSSVTNQGTRLVRVITKDENQAKKQSQMGLHCVYKNSNVNH